VTLTQFFLAEGFGQKIHRAGGQGLRARVVVGMGRDEDDRDRPVGRTQLTLELEAAHARHPHIENQACCVRYVIRT
jgi:hypothetical protein